MPGRSAVTTWPAMALLLVGCCFLQPVVAEVASVFSIHRHGTRMLLPKNAYLDDANAFGGPQLLPEGQRECYEAGSAYRARYIDVSSCDGTCLMRWHPGGSTNGDAYGVINEAGVGFNGFNTYVRSSELARTVESALSFAAGLFPPLDLRNVSGIEVNPGNSSDYFLPNGAQVVPVYTTVDDEDAIIRTYIKCPKYNQVLQSWYASAEFQAMEAESAQLRDRVNAAIQGCDNGCRQNLDTSLLNWYNVWDAFNTRRNFGSGPEVPVISDEDYQEMTRLAYLLEVSKMRSSFTSTRLGGPLLNELAFHLRRVSDALSASQHQAASPGAQRAGSSFMQLHIVSAHYNTLLGVLTALGLDESQAAITAAKGGAGQNGPSWLATGARLNAGTPKLPNPAAVLAFELHVPKGWGDGSPGVGWNGSTTNDLAVRLVQQDGPEAQYVTLPLPCVDSAENEARAAELTGDAGSCLLPSFLQLLGTSLLSPLEWCGACSNQGVSACRLAQLRGELLVQEQRYEAVNQQLQDARELLRTSGSANAGAGGASPDGGNGEMVGTDAPTSAVSLVSSTHFVVAAAGAAIILSMILI
mmetsp:Transcript_22540/g.67104  ORF Transcript_22540/g.67104 Transcript_22540/m.67104 type:complete len:583 (-) Transcript_22540:1111-2859(-)